jgi:hypothetical protein
VDGPCEGDFHGLVQYVLVEIQFEHRRAIVSWKYDDDYIYFEADMDTWIVLPLSGGRRKALDVC